MCFFKLVVSYCRIVLDSPNKPRNSTQLIGHLVGKNQLWIVLKLQNQGGNSNTQKFFLWGICQGGNASLGAVQLQVVGLANFWLT